MRHDVRAEGPLYKAIHEDRLTFWSCRNDEGFNAGDEVEFREVSNHSYHTGRYSLVKILYVSTVNQKEGYVIFGFKVIEHAFRT